MKELIDKYFENTLSDAEKMAFENSLATNQEFREEFEFQNKAQKAIHLKERNELKLTLKQIEAKQTKSDLKIIKKTIWPFVAAAMILILGTVGLYHFYGSNSDNQTLYASYYQTYPNVVSPLVRGENSQSNTQEAFNAYEANNFEAASLLFHQIKDKEYARFYEAVCYLELGKTEKAIVVFNQNTFTDEPIPFETYRKWYLALAYLKIDKKEAAKPLLLELIKTENSQKLQAEELLNKL
jgi:hypothetical protein